MHFMKAGQKLPKDELAGDIFEGSQTHVLNGKGANHIQRFRGKLAGDELKPMHPVYIYHLDGNV